jgi:hypothetical protein
MILLEKLQAINVANLPLIIAGDFNSSPSSSLYTLLHRKHVEAAVGDVNQKKRLKLKHTLWLDSAYLQHEQREPECTFKDISGVYQPHTLLVNVGILSDPTPRLGVNT